MGRHGILFIGGVHAREIVNPDLLVSFALKLCQAYTAGSGLAFGGKSYDSSTIKLIVDSLDTFVFPLVNPDGRVYVQSPTGDAWWRKNRNPAPGSSCIGVDINRNFDFLWSSGIGTSANPCDYQIYKGPGAFSEAETQNVRFLLDSFPNIGCMIDVHSYSEDILYPWGDDDNQTTDPLMNFTNPAYNGLRGVPGDSAYKEYIPQADLDWLISTGGRARDAIAAVRGRVYTVKQSIGLYPTSGTSDDYAYSRHFVDPGKRRVYAYTLETGLEFQPTYNEALNIISEVSAGLVEFCLACVCVAEETVRGTALFRELEGMRAFRDQELLAAPPGRKYVRLLERHGAELLELLARDGAFRKRVIEILRRVNEVVRSRKERKPKIFEADLIKTTESLLQRSAEKASPLLQKDIKAIRRDLRFFRGKTVLEGLELANKAQISQRRR